MDKLQHTSTEQITMNGSFACNDFDLRSARVLVGELMESQLPIEVEWLKKFKEATTDEADSVRVSVRDKQVFFLDAKEGRLDTQALTKEEEDAFLAIVKKYRLIESEPSGMTAWGLFALYVVVIALAQLYWHSDESPLAGTWFLTVATWATISLVIGTAAFAILSRTKSQLDRLALYAVLLGPGFALTVPAALLLMPLFRVGSRQRLYAALYKERTGAR